MNQKKVEENKYMRSFLLTIFGAGFILLGIGILVDIDFKIYQDIGGRYHATYKSDNFNGRIIQE